MTERGASYADVAAAISRSEVATRIAINTRKGVRPIVRTRLQEWLAEELTGAPEVAAFGPTFRPNGTSRVHVDIPGTAD
jgi:hypothetical protein